MWKRQKVHEDVQEMHRAEELVTTIWKMETATSGRPRFGKEEWTGKGKTRFGAENARAMRGIEWDTKW